MELYKKYRPQSLDDIIGNENSVKMLKSMLKKEKLPHAILLTGPKGCGKTTIGRIIKNELNCNDFDFREMDTGVFRGIDTIREIRQQMPLRAMKGGKKLWLLDEAHMLGRGGDSSKNEAQNAFLKCLEDTPEHVYFILCTTNPEMLINTIRSRCIEIKVSALSDKNMADLLSSVLAKEKEKLSDQIIQTIISHSEGSPRNALQILEKALNCATDPERIKAIKSESIFIASQVNALCQALLKGEDWNKIKKILQGLKTEDPETIRRQIIGYAGAVLLNGNESASLILGWFLYKNTYDSGFPLITQFCYNIVTGVNPPC